MQRLLGFALILIGLLMISGVISLATVIYPGDIYVIVYPDGTQSNPTNHEREIQLTTYLCYKRLDSNFQTIMELPNPSGWKVYVDIYDDEQNILRRTELLEFDKTYGPIVESSDTYCYVAIYYKMTTIPDTIPDETLIRYEWDTTVIDENGDEVYFDEYTSYGIIPAPPAPPSGYFTINGERVDQDTTIIVDSLTLDFAFTATENADHVTSVKVQIYKQDSLLKELILSKVSGQPKWKASYTLPGPGTFVVKGLVYHDQGTDPIQLMSILMQYESGEEPPPTPLPFTTSQLLGAFLLIAGLFLVWRRGR